MSDFRRDPLTGRWVIIAPGRAARPRMTGRDSPAAPTAPAFDASCPFCPGNEHMLPGILYERPAPVAPGWLTRVVPNKFPALSPEQAPAGAREEGALRPGHGHHEVIIETPRHNADLDTLPAAHVAEILRTCRDRHAELIARPRIRAVVPFRNRGPQGGASLVHPHAQVIAVGLLPPRMAETGEWARAHHARHGRCVTCETLKREESEAARVVEAGAEFVVLVPFAATAPFEQRILPRRHRASFADADDAEVAALAPVLQRALRRLDAVLERAPYKYVIESAAAGEAAAPHLHWSLRIVPSQTRPGGFEIAAEMPINPSLPERDAKRLRATRLPVTEDETGR